MSEVNVDSSREATSGALPNAAEPMRATPASNGQVQPSACGCASAAEPRFVYALGQVGYDLVNETRLDSIAQHMAGALKVPVDRHLAFDPQQVLAYLQANAFAAASFEWTLMLDGAPVYVIRPQGPFAGDMYGELREALDEQLQKKVDRVAVAGVLSGTAKLLMGQSVPVIAPELRGFYSWNTGALVDAATAPAPPAGATQQDLDAYALKREKVHNWLEHIYHALRNLGVLPQDRAVNFAASNALQMGEIYESALNEKLEFDSIKATPSPLCRPGSDCWDLEIYFFYPERQVQTVRKVWRYTVDVSDAVPATIGPVRSWYTR